MSSQTHILTLIKKIKRKVLNLELAIMSEHENIKTFLQKAMFQIGLKKKTLCCGHVISDLRSEEIVGTFNKKNCKKQIKKSLELKN